MTSEAAFYGWRPTAAQELLLKASLLEGARATAAWEEWIQGVDLARIDPGSRRLLPLLYENLKAEGIDHPLWGRARTAFIETWANNQVLFASLWPLLTSLREAGIDTLLLKGASLALRYYRNLGARPMSDLDILVSAGQASQAIACLNEQHWSAKLRSGRHLAGFISARHALPFVNAAGVELDLHWHVLNVCIGPEADLDFWTGAVPLETPGAPTKALNAADDLFHVCIHAASWNRIPSIRWVADAITITRGRHAIDWPRLLEQAEKRNLSLTLHDALEYLKAQFDAPIPLSLLNGLNRIPVSELERRESMARPLEPGPAWKRPPFLWVYFPRFARDTGRSSGMLGLMDYLRSVWQLDWLCQVPFFAIWLAARRILGLSTEP